MIHNPEIRKLGKKPAVHPKGMRMLAELTSSLPEPPSAVAWYKGFPSPRGAVAAIVNWPMDANDSLGDCTIAGVSHLIQLWTSVIGTPVIPTDAQVIAEYSRLCGYVPGDDSTDNGGVESDILTAWQTGGIFGHKIDGFVGINPKSQTQIKDGIFYFGAVYIGVALPLSAQDQTVWDVPPGGPVGDGAPDSWGGHCVDIVGAGARGVTVVSWGSLITASWDFISTYTDECYAILSPDWIDKSQQTPGGVPLASLRADLKRLVAS